MDSKATLYMGWSSTDITPTGPVALFGQYYERISTHVQSALTVTACAMESRVGRLTSDQAIMISIDLLWCTQAIQEAVRESVGRQLADFDVQKLFIFATHTHSGPEPSAEGDYGQLLVERVSATAIEAWNRRSPSGGTSPAIAYAAIGHNRRVQYADGTTEMYGEVDRADFIGIEGPGDSSLDILFCWGEHTKLEGIIINVPCPAQVTEAKYYVSADYWDDVRNRLRKRFGDDLYVLAQCGAAGDLAPRDLTRGYKAGEPNMWEEDGLFEIGRRIDHAVADVYEQAKNAIKKDFAFRHSVEIVEIPLQTITEEAFNESSAVVQEIHSREPIEGSAWDRFLAEIKANEKIKQYGPWDNKKSDYGIVRKMELEVEQYRTHPQKKVYHAEIHVLRMGNMVFASNPFELFVDFGFIIKGRSEFDHTVIIQLCCDYADYLPTPRAISGGGYSAMATTVGPDGGYKLVEKTLSLINRVS